MSEVRCPFCGNNNTAEAEECKVCGSRLHPMQNGVPAEPIEPSKFDEVPEWLANLRQNAQEGSGLGKNSRPAFTSLEGLNEGETPDFLQSLREDAAAEADEYLSEGDEASQLEKLEPSEDGSPVESVSPFVSETDRIDDQSWLRGLAGLSAEEPEAPESDADDIEPFVGPVDWARRLANEPIAQMHSNGVDETPDAEEDGEWLSRLQNWTGDRAPTEPTESETAPDEQAQTPAFTFDADEPLAVEQIQASAFTLDKDEPPANETDPESTETGQDNSDWLQHLNGSEDQGSTLPFRESADQQVEAEPPAGEMPDWMRDLTGFEPTPDTADIQASVEQDESNFTEDETPAPAEEMVFLADDEPQQAAYEALPQDETEEDLQSIPFLLDEVPDWLSTYSSEDQPEDLSFPTDLPLEPEPEDQAQPFTPFDADHDTDWIAPQPVEEEQAAETLESDSELPEEEIIPAMLPGWVEAMRPVESVLSAEEVRPESEQRIERSGPLAGIPGTIPGEDIATRYHKPPIYSSKLQVTEKQRLHANLLESMIGGTDEPVTPARERRARPSALPRLLIGILMIAALSYVLLTGFPQLSYPNLYPAEAAAFQSALQTVAADNLQPVLVVVDYQPAFAAELETAASVPLQNLAGGGTRLAFVSTSPTGPVLSGRLIENLALRDPAFNLDEQTINLGYLAGGSTGMQAFSLQPSRAVISTFEGQDAWGSPMLSGVQTLDNFGAILVLTDTVENGRDWIEQVQPSLANTPMLMVTSAQSAPLLQPYVNSGQLSGLLAGWYGGISYNIIGRNPTVFESNLWNAYQVGIALMVVLILVGALIQGVVTLISARKKDSGA